MAAATARAARELDVPDLDMGVQILLRWEEQEALLKRLCEVHDQPSGRLTYSSLA